MATHITNKQVSEVLLETRALQPTHKRARVICFDGHDAVSNPKPESPGVEDEKLAPEECRAAHQPPTSPVKAFRGSFTLPPVPETPSFVAGSCTEVVAEPEASCRGSWRAAGGAGRSPRHPSPTPSSTSSSTFSAATTSATMSSRGASLSSSHSWMRGGSARGGSSARSSWGGSTTSSSFSRTSLSSSAGSDFSSTPSLWNEGRRRRSYDSGSGRRDRSCSRKSERKQKHRRWSRRDYASEAEGCGRAGSRYSGRKRSRESGRGEGCGVECSRCLEWCRGSRERKAITRTLPMEYWVRTQACKDTKSKHIDFIDKMAYSREQFIEETVFTCPFTGAQRDIVLERNMFPYDVPTDVEHWTLWSRRDLEVPEMESWVEKWAAKNHPHVVEWEFDNNEGDRSINWYHVHVFFRLGCEDKTGTPRDPSSVYDGPSGTAPSSGGADGK